jgi:hypothetical protein
VITYALHRIWVNILQICTFQGGSGQKYFALKADFKNLEFLKMYTNSGKRALLERGKTEILLSFWNFPDKSYA